MLFGEAQHLDVIRLFLQYEAQGLSHSALWDAVFPTDDVLMLLGSALSPVIWSCEVDDRAECFSSQTFPVRWNLLTKPLMVVCVGAFVQ